MATFTTYNSLTKPEDADFADNDPLNTNFDIIDKGLSFIGQIVMSGSATPPDARYLLCDGSAVSRTTYADLFAYYGTTHGVGDGSTTFNLPNLEEKFVYGYSSGVNAIADSGGKTSYDGNDLPQHTHGMGHTHGMDHDHDIDISDSAGGNNSRVARGTGTSLTLTPGPIRGANTTTTGGSSASLTGDGPGLASTMDIIPPYVVLAFMVRAL